MGKVDWSTALGKIGTASSIGGQASPEPISKAILTVIGAGAGVAQGLRNNAKANKQAQKEMKMKPTNSFPWILAAAGILVLWFIKKK